MTQSKQWADEIVEVLIELGGHGFLRDIYDLIEERGNMVLTIRWRESVRKTIENHSSDSSNYNLRKNLFFSVDGKGKGHWGLRDFEPSNNNVDITEDDEGFYEGKRLLKEHICRERNYKVIRLAKQIFKDKNHKLFCEICNFDFKQKYGDIGEDYIEGHHIIPVSEIPENYKTKAEDIALVCANCHRMLHRKRPWLHKNELKKLIKDNSLNLG